MINIINKTLCCGCNACVQVCPKRCIIMQNDEEGFDYPKVNEDICINCGQCDSVCPILNMHWQEIKPVKTYIAYSNNQKIRLQSSSGGIFSLLAENILEKKGVVFGATFDDEFMVHHICVENVNDLSKLRGSKYLQSRIENTYIHTKKLLEQNRFVLFTGTPCQTAGLKNFLKKDYNNLLIMDILCHGVPSPGLWKYYIKFQEHKFKSKIKRVSFRDKKIGWKKFNIRLEFDNGKEYEKVFFNEIYMQLFLNNLCLRPSCHVCRFKSIHHQSDITLGDSWGVEKYMPHMDDDKGTSVVLIHTQKGENYFEALEDKIVCNYADTNKALPPTADSRKSVLMHDKRMQLFSYMNQGIPFKKISKLNNVNTLNKIINKIKKFIF